jgi:thioredoxin-like negative regulator of GroEL
MTSTTALLLASLLLAAPAPTRAEWLKTMPEAVSASVSRRLPLLVDFQAPWCYSCYYMEQRVLSKPAFQAAAEKVVTLKLDVDTPEGAAAKAKHGVTFLPTYIVLASGGSQELGRIIGEQTEADFLKKLQAIVGGGKSDDAASLALEERIGAGDLDALRGRLRGGVDCRLPYAVFKGEPHVAKLPPGPRAQLLDLERTALTKLADENLFGPAADRCADFRSGVEALADVYEAAGDKPARARLLQRAVAQLDRDADVGQDRNRDDNLRFFLELTDDQPRLKDLYERLIAAYPTDYVYAYRYARNLSEHGKNAAALAYVEKADKRAYGANRLAVTLLRAKILGALGRKPEAAALLKRDIKAGKAAFPKQAQELEKQLATLK